MYWGGLIGGTLAVLAVVVKKRFGVRRIFDVGGPACAAAYAVGRTGCWAVGDDYGRPWRGFLAVAFPQGAPPSTAGVMAREFGIPLPPGAGPTTVLSVYPTQLYEVAMGLVMFGIIWRLRDHKHAEGWLFGVYCVLAGVERFIVEFFRAKDDRLVAGLTYAQLISIGFVVLGIIWLAVFWRVRPGRPGIYASASAPSRRSSFRLSVGRAREGAGTPSVVAARLHAASLAQTAARVSCYARCSSSQERPRPSLELSTSPESAVGSRDSRSHRARAASPRGCDACRSDGVRLTARERW